MFKKLLLSSFILFCFSVNIVSDEVPWKVMEPYMSSITLQLLIHKIS